MKEVWSKCLLKFFVCNHGNMIKLSFKSWFFFFSFEKVHVLMNKMKKFLMSIMSYFF